MFIPGFLYIRNSEEMSPDLEGPISILEFGIVIMPDSI